MRALRAGLCLLGLLACSAPQAPEPTRYLLRSSEPATIGEAAAPARVGLRRISVAPYLQPPGLAFESEPNEIRNARYHRWAEPLEYGLRSLLRSELSALLGDPVDADASGASRWQYAVDVDVDQLHGSASGEALLVADWRISRMPGGEEWIRSRFARRRPLAQQGYPALVEAELALARELARAIAESLTSADAP